MKKVVLVCLVALLALSWTCSVLADNHFVSSPSTTGAPELVKAENASEDCEAAVTIVSYANRDSLPDALREIFEKAYDMIVGRENDNSFSEILARIAQERGLEANDLAVSDFFDISYTDDANHETHGAFDVVLKADALNNFVCLLHYYNGEWKVVDSAEITQNGTHLEFTESEFSPFAIVVYTGEMPVEPPAKMTVGEGILWGAIIAVALAGLGSLFYFVILPWWKKKKEEE